MPEGRRGGEDINSVESREADVNVSGRSNSTVAYASTVRAIEAVMRLRCRLGDHQVVT